MLRVPLRNRALATTAQHLWALLIFAPPVFRRRITAAVVLGACAKARGALRAVVLPSAELAALLPALHAANPRLCRVCA